MAPNVWTIVKMKIAMLPTPHHLPSGMQAKHVGFLLHQPADESLSSSDLNIAQLYN